jgi:hypothetical protein
VLRRSRSARPVAHAQDTHVVVGDPVPDDVRVDERQFAQGRAGYQAAAIREGHKTVARRKQLFS